jgi:dehydrogenase/reductase SDR family member 7B
MHNKVVIITGASSGIGKACALEAGKAGAKVVLTGRSKERLEPVGKLLHELNVEYLLEEADVSREADCQQVVEKTLNCFGQIDVLINNAGVSMRALFEELELDVFKKVMDTNFFGTVCMTKYVLPHILKTNGSIVGMSSINGYRGTPARTAYTASKYAMNGFFEALRTEVMKRGVHVLIVSPGFTATNIRNTALTANGSTQGESPRNESSMMTAEEVAKQTLKAIKNRKREVILTSQGKLAVFLNKWVPGVMDRVVYNVMAKEKDSPFK